MDSSKREAFEAWAGKQNPTYVLHVRPVEQQRGALNIYSNQRTQHAFEGFVGAANSHYQLVAALEDMMEWARAVSDEYIDGGDLRKDYRDSLSGARAALAAAGA